MLAFFVNIFLYPNIYYRAYKYKTAGVFNMNGCRFFVSWFIVTANKKTHPNQMGEFFIMQLLSYSLSLCLSVLPSTPEGSCNEY